MGVAMAERSEEANINFKASRKLTAYLWDIVDEEGFGSTPTTVIQNLAAQAIRQMIADGILTRRPGKFPLDD